MNFMNSRFSPREDSTTVLIEDIEIPHNNEENAMPPTKTVPETTLEWVANTAIAAEFKARAERQACYKDDYRDREGYDEQVEDTEWRINFYEDQLEEIRKCFTVPGTKMGIAIALCDQERSRDHDNDPLVPLARRARDSVDEAFFAWLCEWDTQAHHLLLSPTGWGRTDAAAE